MGINLKIQFQPLAFNKYLCVSDGATKKQNKVDLFLMKLYIHVQIWIPTLFGAISGRQDIEPYNFSFRIETVDMEDNIGEIWAHKI